MVSRLQSELIHHVKAGNDTRAQKALNRLNLVMVIRRNRNIANGMPGKAWVATSLDEAKAQIVSKGL